MSALTATGDADGVGEGGALLGVSPMVLLAAGADVAGGGLADPAADGDVPHAAVTTTVIKTHAMASRRT